MPDLTSEFFVQLGERAHDPWLAHFTGTIRFDLDNGGRTKGGNGAEHWLVSIRDGRITVETDGVGKDTAADATFHTDRTVFDRIIRGEANATATMLRGAAQAEGDPTLLVRFRHLFPAPVTRKAATA
jgi:hypothetical protein